MQIDQVKITDAILNLNTCSDKAKQDGAKYVQGWIDRFYDTDLTFKVNAVEQEMIYWLDYRTALVGKVDLPDAVRPDGKAFFGEWKTVGQRSAKTWKRKWKLSAQALTYGVLTNRGVYTTSGERAQANNLFLVRVALKLRVPDYDFEWFSYEQGELNFWEEQLKSLAEEIRGHRAFGRKPWGLNLDHCYQYGDAYVCPFYENGCSKLKFEDSTGFKERVSHLAIERDKLVPRNNLVVLDATRINTYGNCQERYRKQYEENLDAGTNEAMQTGTVLHEGLGEYYRQLAQTR